MSAKPKALHPGRVYQLKVTLKGAQPPIWRRIQVSEQITLAKLHRILQVTMGWTDSHLHQFRVGKTYYGEPEPDYDLGFVTVNEKKVKLNQLPLKEKSKFLYEYDFGDSWEHEILVEKILPQEEGKTYPLCLTGKRACPPEDSGGVWGYAGFLEAISDPSHPDHEEMLDWIGGSFDPEEFDLEGVNRYLSSLR